MIPRPSQHPTSSHGVTASRPALDFDLAFKRLRLLDLGFEARVVNGRWLAFLKESEHSDHSGNVEPELDLPADLSSGELRKEIARYEVSSLTTSIVKDGFGESFAQTEWQLGCGIYADFLRDQGRDFEGWRALANSRLSLAVEIHGTNLLHDRARELLLRAQNETRRRLLPFHHPYALPNITAAMAWYAGRLQALCNSTETFGEFDSLLLLYEATGHCGVEKIWNEHPEWVQVTFGPNVFGISADQVSADCKIAMPITEPCSGTTFAVLRFGQPREVHNLKRRLQLAPGDTAEFWIGKRASE